MMAFRIVQNQNCALFQLRQKVLLQKGFQIDSLDGTFFFKGANHAQKVEGTKNRKVLATLKRNRFNKSYPTSGPAVRKIHRQMKARFIEENEPLRSDLSYFLLKLSSLPGISFAGYARLFLRVILSRLQVSERTLTVGLTPCFFSQAFPRVSRVQSVREATRARKSSSCSFLTILGRPGTGRGSRHPRSRRCRLYRCTLVRDRAKRSAASLSVAPSSQAARTLSRRSTEYAFMKTIVGSSNPKTKGYKTRRTPRRETLYLDLSRSSAGGF
jgi:hypothetical protein